ncbi:NAD-dependent epimerase/dehydratase family protein [Candidatus Hakubella thermalkaliphila]|uniref:UDP-glucose 4-epimerase n=3 Tax=Candidatus Hakubella thermalkaliphila TaxID=2754717 RepID=A0A6V8Q2G4_9ACTN|nr:NAD-dependent epimerase/dehydratase family protein [Candidatus Hakubella thermalkaliphila]GFP29802.1 UDP-glucose 4-epimerase [Candidatus Hakubella thermalkaliphila]GFP38935.1 UDP-glucose 4-epimerase [Candidatus Hakubella thermalkaliphila]
MRILVTGGAGFIGSHVVDRYIGLGHEVTVVDNLLAGKEKYLNPEAKFYQLDIRHQQELEQVFRKGQFEIVNHHAAQIDVRKSVRDPLSDADINICGSLILLEGSLKYKVRKFIFASSGGAVYGEPLYLPVDEDHPIDPGSPYGVSKHTFEHYLHLYSALYGLKYTALRYSNVYGPRQDYSGEAGVIAIFISRMLSNDDLTINGDGEQIRDYIYVDDVVDANVKALGGGDGEILNIGTGRGISVNTVFVKLKEMSGYRKDALPAPLPLGDLRKIYLDNRKAKTSLGWQPKTSFEEGLVKTVQWFNSPAENPLL